MSKATQYIVGTLATTGAVVGGVALYRRLSTSQSDGGQPAPLPNGQPQPVPQSAPAPAPVPAPAPAPIPAPHGSSLSPIAWDGALPLPTAAEVKGDLSRNWGIVPVDLRPLLLKVEEVSGIFGAARFLGIVAYQESRFVANAHRGDEPDEQGERDGSWRGYHNRKDKNPPLMFGDAAANFGSGGLFAALAPYALWTGVQELKSNAPLLNSDPRILFLPRVAAFCAAVYLHRVLSQGYDVRDIADIKVAWGSISFLTEQGRKGADYTRIRNKFADDVKKVGIDLNDAATMPKMLAASPQWPGVQAVFDQLVVKLPTPAKGAP